MNTSMIILSGVCVPITSINQYMHSFCDIMTNNKHDWIDVTIYNPIFHLYGSPCCISDCRMGQSTPCSTRCAGYIQVNSEGWMVYICSSNVTRACWCRCGWWNHSINPYLLNSMKMERSLELYKHFTLVRLMQLDLPIHYAVAALCTYLFVIQRFS